MPSVENGMISDDGRVGKRDAWGHVAGKKHGRMVVRCSNIMVFRLPSNMLMGVRRLR